MYMFANVCEKTKRRRADYDGEWATGQINECRGREGEVLEGEENDDDDDDEESQGWVHLKVGEGARKER